MIVEAHSKLRVKYAGHSDIQVFAELRSARQNVEVSEAAKKSVRDQSDVTSESETAQEEK